MSTRVYGWEQNPIVDRFAYRCSNTSAALAVVDGFAEEIVDGDGRKAIQLREPSLFDQELQRSSNAGPFVSAKVILQFIRTHCDGAALHYEIPMAGDLGMRRYNLFRRGSLLSSRVIRVSSRNLFANGIPAESSAL